MFCEIVWSACWCVRSALRAMLNNDPLILDGPVEEDAARRARSSRRRAFHRVGAGRRGCAHERADMLVICRQRFAQQLAIHADFPCKQVCRLLQALLRLAHARVELLAELLFKFAQLCIFATTEKHVDLATTL